MKDFKEINDNAPRGATHFYNGFYFMKGRNWFKWDGSDFVYCAKELDSKMFTLIEFPVPPDAIGFPAIDRSEKDVEDDIDGVFKNANILFLVFIVLAACVAVGVCK